MDHYLVDLLVFQVKPQTLLVQTKELEKDLTIVSTGKFLYTEIKCVYLIHPPITFESLLSLDTFSLF